MFPAAVEDGIERFNRGEFFEAHEVIEEAWRAESDPERRRLWQGLIQIAVGFTHLRRNNPGGAITLLNAGLGKLRPLRPEAHGLDVESLYTGVAACVEQIDRGQRDGGRFDWAGVPRMEPAGRA